MTSVNAIDAEFFEQARTYFGDVVTYDPELGGLVLYDTNGSSVLLNPTIPGRRNDPSLRDNLHDRTRGALEEYRQLQTGIKDVRRRVSSRFTATRRPDVVNMSASTMKQLYTAELQRRASTGTTDTANSIAANRREALFRLINRQRAGSQGQNNAAANAGGLIISFADSEVTSHFLRDSQNSAPSSSDPRSSAVPSTVGRPSFVGSAGSRGAHPLDVTSQETEAFAADLGGDFNAIVHFI